MNALHGRDIFCGRGESAELCPFAVLVDRDNSITNLAITFYSIGVRPAALAGSGILQVDIPGIS